MKKSVMSGLLRVLVCVGVVVAFVATLVIPQAKAEEAQMIRTVYIVPEATLSTLQQFMLARLEEKEMSVRHAGIRKAVHTSSAVPAEITFRDSFITSGDLELSPPESDLTIGYKYQKAPVENTSWDYRLLLSDTGSPSRTTFDVERPAGTGWGSDRFSYSLKRFGEQKQYSFLFLVSTEYPVSLTGPYCESLWRWGAGASVSFR